MVIELQIAPLTRHADGFPGYWTKTTFISRPFETYEGHAILSNFVRLVDGVGRSYRNAKALTEIVYAPNSGWRSSESHAAVLQFDCCIIWMHRAICCWRRARVLPNPPKKIAAVLMVKRAFSSGKNADLIRAMRDSLTHIESKVINGRVPTNTPYCPFATGPEIPAPTEKNFQQTKKIIDRLVVGKDEILFTQLVALIEEMGDCAASIADAIPSRIEKGIVVEDN